MKRTLKILGRQVAFESAEGDGYLASIPEDLEPTIRTVFSSLLREDARVVDVGANIGLTTACAALRCPSGFVLSIEASPRTFSHLEHNVRANGLANVSCVNAAVADEPGELELRSAPGFSAWSFVSDSYGKNEPGLITEHVRAARLDDLVAEAGMGSIDFLKIDVEGSELGVLRGAAATLRKHRPMALMEVNHWCLNVFRRISIVDFIDAVLEIFPHVYALDQSLAYIDLRPEVDRYHFLHEHVLKGRFTDLLCSFELERLAPCLAIAAEREAMARERDQLSSDVMRLRTENESLRSLQTQILESRSWRLTAPLRHLGSMIRSTNKP